MSDTAQQSPSKMQTPVSRDTSVKPIAAPQQQPVTQQQTIPVPPIATPASVTPHKEAGPIPVPQSLEAAKPMEMVQQSTPEVTVPPEVKEVLTVSEAAKPITVDVQLQKAGVTPAADSTPVVHTPNGDVKLPMTYPDALALEKRTSFRSAIHWFAAFVAYQWRKLDPSLKN